MPWPIPVFSKIEYPKPISLRVWLPTLAVVAAGAAGAVLMFWPQGTPTNTVQFWGTLVGAPLVACALLFGPKRHHWEREQTIAEESVKEQQRLNGLWSEWSRRRLSIVDVAAFLAATKEVARFGAPDVDLPTNTDRTLELDWTKGRSAASRQTRLLYVVARRFADVLRGKREVVITLMLGDLSLEQVDFWTRRTSRIFGRRVQNVAFRVEAQAAAGGAQWITELVDRVDATTRLVIAAQLWPQEEEKEEGDPDGSHDFSEGAAAFLIEPGGRQAGSIFRPMTSTRETLEADLEQIKQYQAPSEPLTHVWFTGCEDDESTAIRSALTTDPKNPVIERLLDKFLGVPGPASGWIALAAVMEAKRGGAPQLVAWKEPGSDPLHLCMVAPLPQEETSV